MNHILQTFNDILAMLGDNWRAIAALSIIVVPMIYLLTNLTTYVGTL